MYRALPLLAALAIAASAPAAASVARAVEFEEKVAASDAIVHARVVDSVSAWDASRRFIVTHSTIEVEKALKGTPARRITLVTPGGTVDGIRQETIGVPRLAPGMEKVVFVRESSAGATVAFFDQGVYDIQRDGRGRPTVRPTATALVTIDPASGVASSSASEPPMPLAEFERRVQRASLLEEHRAEAATPVEPSTVQTFVREHWKLIAAAGLALVLAMIPLILRMRS